MNLRSIDLNLLVVFDAIYAERNVTRAAEKIALSQPAVSGALGRLRVRLRDQLFLRGPEGLLPTPRAQELALPIRRILMELEQVLDPVVFDPATASRTFTIAVIDYFTLVIIPPLLRSLRAEAPGVRLRFVPSSGHIFEALDHGDIDFAISAFGDVPERFEKRFLLEDRYACLVARDNPLAHGKVTLQRYACASHLLVSPRGGGRGFVDDRLAEQGLTRQVPLTINHFSAAPLIVASSDLVLTAPMRVINALINDRMVRIESPIEAPVDFRRLELVWNRRLANHPAHEWFRQTVQQVADSIQSEQCPDA